MAAGFDIAFELRLSGKFPVGGSDKMAIGAHRIVLIAGAGRGIGGANASVAAQREGQRDEQRFSYDLGRLPLRQLVVRASHTDSADGRAGTCL